LQAKHRNKIVALHDEFRLALPGPIYDQSNAIAGKRQDLIARKIILSDTRASLDAELTDAKSREQKAAKALADAEVVDPALQQEYDDAHALVTKLTRSSTELVVRLGLVDSLVAAIDAFTAAVRVIPPGGRRSSLSTAALLQSLHDGAEPRFTHVLLVKSQPAQAAQLTDDKPLWFKDKFSTIVEVNVTYILIATADSRIVRAGTATATTAAHGDLGSEIAIKPIGSVAGVWSDSQQPPRPN
jgi:hypothetical protein